MEDNDPVTTAEQSSEAAEALFAERLRALREAAEMTQGQLAERMTRLGFSMHQTTIAKIERSQRPVRLNEVAAFAAALRVQVTDLLTDSESTPKAAALWAELHAVTAQRLELTRRLEAVEMHRAVIEEQRAEIARQLQAVEQSEIHVRKKWQAARTTPQLSFGRVKVLQDPKVPFPAANNGGALGFLILIAAILWNARKEASSANKGGGSTTPSQESLNQALEPSQKSGQQAGVPKSH